MRNVLLFLSSCVLWLVLVSYNDVGELKSRVFIEAVIISLFIVMVFWKRQDPKKKQSYDPLRIARVMVLCIPLGVAVAWEWVIAALDCALRILHPHMPLRPGIVKVSTSLTSTAAITLFAHALTVCPGTQVVEALPDGTLYVHWLYVTTDKQEEIQKRIVGRIENLIKKMFD